MHRKLGALANGGEAAEDLAGERVEVFSAGSKPSVVKLDAIRAMRRRGIDISGQRVCQIVHGKRK